MAKGGHAALKVVEKMDNIIHWINLYPVDNEIIILICLIVIHPVDSAFYRLNN